MVQPFRIDVSRASLDDLRARLGRTRWPDEVRGAGWDYGANLDYMRELAAYWRDRFDWRVQERRLNELAHFRTELDGLGIHVVHERGRGPRPLPLLITHGWPSTFAEMVKLIPLLTDPAGHGGDAADSFDVVAPSVPGFGFSDRPLARGMTRSRVAGLWVRLMERLGYRRFAAHANDIGAVISAFIALDHPDRLIALHTLMPGFPRPHVDPAAGPPLSPAEEQFLETQRRWEQEEGGYNRIQETRPQTLAYGLHDSPVALAAWIIEKWRAWTDPRGAPEDHFTRDELLTNVSLYWFTETAHAAARSYYERARDPRVVRPDERIRVPTGVALTTEAVQRAPRAWVERRYTDLRHWTEFARGGHFLALEEPELLARDLRVFFRPFR